jgi:indolepyruvate ferredoxin oxidoreductase
LILAYENTIDKVLEGLRPDNLPLGIEIASIPAQIRGFGHVKEASMDRAVECEAALLERYLNPGREQTAAE